MRHARGEKTGCAKGERRRDRKLYLCLGQIPTLWLRGNSVPRLSRCNRLSLRVAQGVHYNKMFTALENFRLVHHFDGI